MGPCGFGVRECLIGGKDGGKGGWGKEGTFYGSSPTDLRTAKEVQTIEVYKHEVRAHPMLCPCSFLGISCVFTSSSILLLPPRSARGPTMGAGLDVWQLTPTGW